MEIYEWIVFLTVFGEVTAHNPFAGCMKENTYGYGYLQYFDVDILPKNAPDAGRPSDPKARFYLEFYVRASQNAHILLAEQNHEAEGLEVLLGGGSNTFCQIRRLRNKRRQSLTTRKMAKTVSDTEDRGFWIEVDSSEYLLVGRIGENEPFLFNYNKITIPIRYFSFATWTNTKGVWHFACPKNPGPGMDEEERNLTTTARLRGDLFNYYNPYQYPEKDGDPSQTVQVHLEAYGIYLDEKRGELEINWMANVIWNDRKLIWNPQDYDNITETHVSPYLPWTPNIQILNSATFKKTTLLTKKGSASIKNTGEVTWRTQGSCVTLCLVGYKKWPYDRHNCTVIIGFSTEPLKIRFETMVLRATTSTWEIQISEENGNVTYANDERNGVVHFILQRRNPSAIVRNYVVPPFLSAAMLTLLSFWANPNGPVKLFLCSASVFILIVTLLILGDTLPNVLSAETAGFYHVSVFIYSFPVLFLIGLRYLPDSVNAPRNFADFLNSGLSETLFCFPKKPQVQPGKLSTREEIEHSNNAFLLSLLYERLAFFVYLLIFLVSFITALAFLEIIL